MKKNQIYKTFWEDLRNGKFASMVKESAKGEKISHAEEVFNVLRPLVAQHPDQEVLYGVFLATNHRIIAIEELSRGTINTALVYPREIIKTLIKLRANALIIAHNHPSGDIAPSTHDIAITKRLYLALKLFDANLLDSVIIGNDKWHSIHDDGLFEKFREDFRVMHL